MPMNMGIHRKPIGQGHSAFLDSHRRGNDGVGSFPENALEGGDRLNGRFQGDRHMSPVGAPLAEHHIGLP